MDKIQEEIIEEFSVFDDWLDKYDYLIGLADTLPAIDPTHGTIPDSRLPIARVGGCPHGQRQGLLCGR